MTGADLQFREFFAAEYGRLRGLGYLLTSDWGQAEELAQDALVRTYRAWPRVRGHDRPGAYARKVLVNRHRSLLRRAKVEARHLAGRRVEEAVQPELGTDGLVLKETLDRVAGGGPDEAGAFDRFLRHRRASRSRRLAAATASGPRGGARLGGGRCPASSPTAASRGCTSPARPAPSAGGPPRWSPWPLSRGSRSTCRPAGRPARPGRASSCGRSRRTSAATLAGRSSWSRASSRSSTTRPPTPEGRHRTRTSTAAERPCRGRSRAGPRATSRAARFPGADPLVPD